MCVCEGGGLNRKKPRDSSGRVREIIHQRVGRGRKNPEPRTVRGKEADYEGEGS